MGKITFIVGGTRSGKSAFALKTAAGAKKVAFIATCEPKDSEMKRRVSLHINSRPRNWKTFEAPHDADIVLKKVGADFDCIIIDCLTLMVSNMMIGGFKEAAIKNKISGLLEVLKKIKSASIIVSNEVGLGIVPENKLARDFRDIAGRINQVVAGESDSVFFTVSGIPWRIK